MTDKRHGLRSIAAPFQNQTVEIQSIAENHAVESLNLSDFRNFTFPPLQPASDLKQDEYYGPTTESNWVIPNILLVGAYPATQDDDETYDILISILKLGIKKFVCLQQEYRPGVPEELWRSGLALRPYFEDVVHLVKHKDLFPSLANFDVVTESVLSFEHCPIVDCGITDDSKVLDLSRKLVDEISRGQVIYLHCWGGHGRTGTIVSIMLHLMYGLNPNDAMNRCQLVHDLRRCPVEVGSPQTQAQRDQVTRVITRLILDYRMNSNLNSNLSRQKNTHQNQADSQKKPSTDGNFTPNEESISLTVKSAKPQEKLHTQYTRFPYFPYPANNSKAIVARKQVQSAAEIQTTRQEQSAERESTVTQTTNSRSRNSKTRKSVIWLSEAGNESTHSTHLNAANETISEQPNESMNLDENADEINMQFVRIDLSSCSEDGFSSEKEHGVSGAVVTEESLKFPSTAVNAATPSSSSKLSIEPSKIAEALSNARRSIQIDNGKVYSSSERRDIAGKLNEGQEISYASSKAFISPSQPVNIAANFTHKRLVPSRPPNHATSGARFGVANFMNRKMEAPAKNAPAIKSKSTSFVVQGKSKELLNIFGK